MPHIPGPPPPRRNPPRESSPPRSGASSGRFSNEGQTLGGDGLLSGAHNPAVVIFFGLGFLVGVPLVALNLWHPLADLEQPLDLHRRAMESRWTLGFVTAGAFGVSTLCALIMRKWVLALVCVVPVMATLGLAFYNNQRFEEREARVERENAEREARFADIEENRARFSNFCTSPKGDPKAAKYRKGKGVHQFVEVVSGDTRTFTWSINEHAARKRKDTALVLCVGVRREVLETCRYEGGVIKSRISHPIDLQVYAARTGELLHAQRVDPREPPLVCPFSITAGSNSGDISAMVHHDQIKEVVTPFIGEPSKGSGKKSSKTSKSSKKSKKSKKSNQKD